MLLFDKADQFMYVTPRKGTEKNMFRSCHHQLCLTVTPRKGTNKRIQFTTRKCVMNWILLFFVSIFSDFSN